MGTMVIRLQIYRELMLRLFCLSCGGPGLSADCRIEPAVWHPDGLFRCSFIKYPVYVPF